MLRSMRMVNLCVYSLLVLFSLPCIHSFFHSPSSSMCEKKGLLSPFLTQKEVKMQFSSLVPQNTKGRNMEMRVSSHNNGKFPGGNSILSQNVNNMNENDQPSVVYVANLPYAATVEEIEQFFSSCGPVVDVKIIRDQYTKRSKGYCFVKFSEAIHATVAIEQFNGKDFMGRSITCRPAFRSGGYTSSRSTTNNQDEVDISADFSMETNNIIEDDDELDESYTEEDMGK